MALDPIVMARFLVMPGAEELVDAFSRIPEGPLRQSVIQHAQVIAATYASAPPDLQMVDPLLTAARETAAAVPALDYGGAEPSGKTRRGTPKTPEEQMIDLRMKGLDAGKIGRKIAVPPMEVARVLAKAERGGVEFPPLRKRGAPEEPAVWPIPYAEQDWLGQKMTRYSAKLAGLTIEQQQAREADVVRRFKAGQYPVEIAERLGIKDNIVGTIRRRALKEGVILPPLRKGGGARKAMGRPVTVRRPGLQDAEFTDGPPPPTPAPQEAHQDDGAAVEAPTLPGWPVRPPAAASPTVLEPGQRVFGRAADLPTSAQVAVRKAAARRGATLEAYEDLRESIVRHRLDGRRPSQIAALTGEPRQFVKDTLEAAQALGVAFPPYDLELAAHG